FQRAPPAGRRRAVQHAMAVLHQLLQALHQLRAVAAFAGQRQLLAQPSVTLREADIAGFFRARPAPTPTRGTGAMLQPLLQVMPFLLMAGDELLLLHRRPSNQLAIAYRRSTPTWPDALVNGSAMPASSCWRAGDRRGARSAKAITAACSSGRSGCGGASALSMVAGGGR